MIDYEADAPTSDTEPAGADSPAEATPYPSEYDTAEGHAHADDASEHYVDEDHPDTDEPKPEPDFNRDDERMGGDEPVDAQDDAFKAVDEQGTMTPAGPDTELSDEPVPDGAPPRVADTVASEMVIHVEDHKIDVEVTGAPDKEAVNSVQDMSDEDLDRVKRALADESARRGDIGARAPREFEHVDTESLRILQNKLRNELSSR